MATTFKGHYSGKLHFQRSGVAAPALPHLYWRVSFPTIPGGGVGIGEISFLDSTGTILNAGGTPFATGTYSPGSGFDPAEGFDNNTDTFWCGTSAPASLGYLFPSAVKVDHIILTNRTDVYQYGATFPPNYKIEFSDDGVTYTSAGSGTIPSTPAGGSITLPVVINTATVYGGLTARGAWGLRVLGDGYSGPLIQVQRASDNAVLDIAATGGTLDTATLAAFASGTTANIVTLYDQSGNGNDFFTSYGLVSVVTSSGIPALGSGLGFILAGSNMNSVLFFHNQPFTTIFAQQRSAVGYEYQCLLGGLNTSSGMGLGWKYNNYDLQQNGVSDTPILTTNTMQNTPYVTTCSSSTGITAPNVNTTVDFFTNGSLAGEATLSYNGSPVGGTTLGSDGGNDKFYGTVGELAVFDQLSSSDQAAVENTMRAAYGI